MLSTCPLQQVLCLCMRGQVKLLAEVPLLGGSPSERPCAKSHRRPQSQVLRMGRRRARSESCALAAWRCLPPAHAAWPDDQALDGPACGSCWAGTPPMPLAGLYHTDQLRLLQMSRIHHNQAQCLPQHMQAAPIACLGLTCASHAPGVPDEEWRTRHLMLPVFDCDVVSRPARGGLGAHHIPAICNHSGH